ncbi:ISC system 2Fe-2S type ferredoxin [Candidatus Berkiella cookevillensis]|uniref:2Fe-2S ferredoxin n=1 Tax=Candidatus Berkiella cookevillensis TaxID=437022 RepID=A0A0Q9YCJ0_9GAMM|nr:ISC system 2Fe-2S type ferredoxin [Candidatus Berkiella cookevillensis]MCS5708721.1 ISC system 2Fe-2S type ferredoxin [Candidatus Berkiella cookevillensis]
MTKITFLPHEEICPEGKTVEALPGQSILEVALEHDIHIEHACEMSCACTTCHVIVRKGYDSLIPPEEREEDLLDRAWGLEPESRLSCQSIIEAEDLEIEIPKYTINHVSEKG